MSDTLAMKLAELFDMTPWDKLSEEEREEYRVSASATLASLLPEGGVLEAAAKAMYGHWFGWEPESLDSAWRKETPQARAVWVECAQSASRLLLADKEREVEELRGNVEYWQRTADRLAVANQTLLDGGTR